MNTTSHPMQTHTPMNAAWPRFVTGVIGLWLFISAFVWPHSSAQMTNTWICGVLVVVLAWVAAYSPRVRFVNTLLAIWVFISAFALPTVSVGTTWNNAIVGILVFVLSLIPSEHAPRALAS